MRFIDLLKLPEARQIQDLDLPETTLLHRKIILSKPFLKRLYLDFYALFKRSLPNLETSVCVELGSGGGFIKEVYPSVITSDILKLSHVDQCFSALAMPFQDSSVDAFIMIDVFHHVPDSLKFLQELQRCLKPGGKIVMIEPANTWWGRFINQNFHHEPFLPNAGWTIPSSGPLSGANGALPYIVFKRDIKQFQAAFPNLRLISMKPHTPFRYLISGGVSMRQLLPSFAYSLIKILEWLLTPLNAVLGMFYTLTLEKV